MTSLFKNLSWKPSTVSWLSFVLMGLIVAGVGLSGTAHVINYLQERLMAHGMHHNQEVASAIMPKIEAAFHADYEDPAAILSHAIEDYKSFGFRFFVLDRENRTIVVDSESSLKSPIPIDKSWLANAKRLNGSQVQLLRDTGAFRLLDQEQHPLLVWLQNMNTRESGRWILGVARDQKTITDFMGDLHWHLDAVLLLTFVLITLLGYFAMRSIGRTYERRLESKIKRRTEELEEAHNEILLKTRLATIGQTAAVLTHEMRNPLTSIKFALSGLRGTPALDARERRRVDLVLGEVDRLDLLLSETLDYVRPVKRSIDPVDLDELLDKVLRQQMPIMEEKGIHIIQEHCSDCTSMRLDKEQVQQVLLNLIKNAIEASPRGGEISTALRYEENRLVVEITNSGKPLSEEIQQCAFEPFFTTKPKGTGLGLGLVKRVVEEHGGTVALTSNEEIGTRLTLIFPRNPS